MASDPHSPSPDAPSSSRLRTALAVAYAVVVIELVSIAFIRYRYMKSPLGRTIVQVIGGGRVVFAVGLWLGRLGASGRP